MISQPLNALKLAQTSAFRIFSMIDRIPDIDAYSSSGLLPSQCRGNIIIKDVHFSYPSRPDQEVIKRLNMEMKSGETIAIVGESGCGKSTIVQLLQRLYDITNGSITLDENELKELNVSWLRNHIGVVNQEPTLFAGTIRENILLGKREGEMPNDDDIIECAKMANAHDFILELPDDKLSLFYLLGTVLVRIVSSLSIQVFITWDGTSPV